jgi:carboxymethylenebutenolidase
MIHVPAGWVGPKQAEPLEVLRSGHADRVMAIIGEKDPYTPSNQVDELREVGVTVVAYPEAEHGFAHDASRPAHRADDAADAFNRAKAWLLG